VKRGFLIFPVFSLKTSVILKAKQRGYINFNNRIKTLVFLLKKYRPLHLACENGHLSIVKLLVKKGCQVESQTNWVKNVGIFTNTYFLKFPEGKANPFGQHQWAFGYR